ncbi:coenzyme A transferase domain-containing protein [Rhizoctonia solani AG-1 IA]|uniref:Coenzyme A transferase domain-containing protein n=1 Tax=Thanatephorus cucumeris (strain AG1-IA) TaxID=983506 RepID=L8WH55_THACA|nr:coenzyme A transferase domain-containing protein [Rhizoctonia solani AG-1 IA]
MLFLQRNGWIWCPILMEPRSVASVIVMMEHVAKGNKHKIMKECALPLTGPRCVSQIITDLCVFDIDRKQGKMTLTELQPGVTLAEVREKTDADYDVAPGVKEIPA